MMRFIRLLAIILALLTPWLAHSTADTTVSIVNFYPGPEIFELEGHTALRLQTSDMDIAVSYGMFNFDDPNFVYRFVKGETDYRVGIVPWQPFVDSYLRQKRRIVEHVVDMTPQQLERLFNLLDQNLLPQNRVYRYNYIRDNCATRPLRIIEKAMGDTILLGAPTSPLPNPTFRNIMRHYHVNYPWYQFGIDLCLGPGIDNNINNREVAFAPAVLDGQLISATVNGKPLVSRTIVVNDVPADNAVEQPTPWMLTPMAVALLWLVIAIGITVYDIRRHKVSRWFDTLMLVACFIPGCIIFYLVTISLHAATTPNWLILWLNPLLIIPAVCLWIKRAQKLLICWQFINFALLMAFAVAVPLSGQSINSAFIPLIVAEIIRGGNYLYITHKKTSTAAN